MAPNQVAKKCVSSPVFFSRDNREKAAALRFTAQACLWLR